MTIACVQHEAVLEHEGGDPEIIRWHRRSPTAQLGERSRVVKRGLFIRTEHGDSGLGQETP